MKKLAVLAAIALSTAPTANAGEFSLGLVTSYSPAVYKGLDSDVVPFPMIGYEGKHLYLRGTGGGIRLRPAGSPFNVIGFLQYDPRTLRPGDSDDLDIQKLDEREPGVLGGVTLQAVNQAGVFQFSVGSDVTGDHYGLYSEVTWKKPFINGRYGLIPEVGYAYNSDKLNNHLYGVSSAEAERTRFDAFDAGWSGKLFVGASSYMHITKKIRITGSLRYTKLDDELANSPIVKTENALSGTLGVAYVF
ncbi:MipA/OmpV family protein [Photobacterium sagamiensis]|uniref:MipA/OmpV family protein n=1 Tax=Photobacterium sagamiensis TaxID=2910241 RepID=UPI003D0CB82B